MLFSIHRIRGQKEAREIHGYCCSYRQYSVRGSAQDIKHWFLTSSAWHFFIYIYIYYMCRRHGIYAQDGIEKYFTDDKNKSSCACKLCKRPILYKVIFELRVEDGEHQDRRSASFTSETLPGVLPIAQFSEIISSREVCVEFPCENWVLSNIFSTWSTSFLAIDFLMNLFRSRRSYR